MKKLLTLIAFAAVLGLTAQNIPPQAINFQGVAIDKNGIPVPGMDELGNPIQNSAIRVRFSILAGSATGTVSYQEEHLTTTDEFGRFNLEIGRGTAINGTFTGINWGGDKHFLQVEVDLSALGTNYTLASVQEFLSVPYALYSRSSASSNDDFDKDPQNEIQTLSLSGNVLNISQGNSVTLPVDLDQQQLSISGGIISISNGNSISLPVDSDNQTLSVSGSNLSIANGNTVTLPVSQDNQTLTLTGSSLSITNGNSVSLLGFDSDSTNELQSISINGNMITLSNNGGSITLPQDQINDADADPSNELQTISINNRTVSLSMNGGSFTIPQDADADSTNELQTISIANDTIFLSSGGYVKLPNTSTPINSSKSITSSQLDDLFGLQYTGNGLLGDFHSATTTLPTMKFLNYDDFFLMPGDTLNLVAQINAITPTTTVLFVQDTCYLAGFINGKGTGQSNRNLSTNTPYSMFQTFVGLQAASGTNNSSTGYTGSPVYFREGQHSVKWNEWALLSYLDPYQEYASNLLNDTSFKVCASQYGEISGQDGGTNGSSYGAYGGRGGRGLIIIAKTLIVNNAIFDLRGSSGTASPNTAYRGGAGGGGSLFISYETGTIVNPAVNTSGGTAIPTPTSIPLTNGGNGRFLFHQR